MCFTILYFKIVNKCFTKPSRSTYIDLSLTNSPLSFQNMNITPTGLSDFQKTVILILKYLFIKLKAKVRATSKSNWHLYKCYKLYKDGIEFKTISNKKKQKETKKTSILKKNK